MPRTAQSAPPTHGAKSDAAQKKSALIAAASQMSRPAPPLQSASGSSSSSSTAPSDAASPTATTRTSSRRKSTRPISTSSRKKATAAQKRQAARSKKVTASKDEGVTKKKRRRFRPGTVAMREIRREQKKSDKVTIPKLPFQRLVREIAEECKEGVRFQASAIEALQEASEQYVTELLEEAYEMSIHRGRITLMAKDVELCRKIRKNHGVV